MFQHLLLPTDGSHLSRETAERAVSFAKVGNVKITALYAKVIGHPPEDYTDLAHPAAVDRMLARSEGKAKEYLGFIKKLCKEAGVECTTLAVVSDTPWEAIVKAAEDNNCDLIFMAKHSRSGLSSILVGSQTYRVLTHSSVPVLVFRASKHGASEHKAKAKEKDKKKA